jgi:hypothetical protein
MCGETTLASRESFQRFNDGRRWWPRLTAGDEHIASIFLFLPLFDKPLEYSLDLVRWSRCLKDTSNAQHFDVG